MTCKHKIYLIRIKSHDRNGMITYSGEKVKIHIACLYKIAVHICLNGWCLTSNQHDV